MRTLKAAVAWLSESGALHPGGTTALQLGKVLSGSPLVAFQTRAGLPAQQHA